VASFYLINYLTSKSKEEGEREESLAFTFVKKLLSHHRVKPTKFKFCRRKVNLGSISSTFYKLLLYQYSCAKKLQSQTVTREKLQKHFCMKKSGVKC